MGIVHRDLNLTNVWMPDINSYDTQGLSIKVVDFSYSCLADKGATLQASVGDPYYHSSERAAGKSYG